MIYTNDRHAYRQAFFDAWQKHLNNEPVFGIEFELIQVMVIHPEYHSFLSHPDETEFELEENPFLHMGLHLSIRDQIKTKKPEEIVTVYQKLMAMGNDQHEVEHLLMDCLAKTIWDAQQSGKFDLEKYIERIKGLEDR